MLGRVERLEQARGGADDVDAFAAFVADSEAGMDAGRLDRRDFTEVLVFVATWRTRYGVSFADSSVGADGDAPLAHSGPI